MAIKEKAEAACSSGAARQLWFITDYRALVRAFSADALLGVALLQPV